MVAFLVLLFFGGVALAEPPPSQIEKKIRKYIASDEFRHFRADRRCQDQNTYRVYLIDNFEQGVDLVPEIKTSHGEMLVKLLRTGRDDIQVRTLNTALSRGLAQVFHDLVGGECVDAVVSSIPGSNYTYTQISSLFADGREINAQNILYHRSALRALLRSIATRGFPSVAWLQGLDVNAVKLRNDARKFLFIEALGRFNVPVILPYGNADARHKGRIKAVNLLSLASNARVYSALDQKGVRVPGYPYSPLSTGDAPAVYNIVECPHPADPFKAVLDINDDGLRDYTFFRVDKIAYRNARGEIDFAPPVTRQDVFVKWLARIKSDPACRIEDEMVITAGQYRQLQRCCPEAFERDIVQPYVWLNAPQKGRLLEFAPTCRARGILSGTSVIPPHKIKELLPPKRARAPVEKQGAHPPAAGG
jgi:hypothetical protein